MTLRKYLFKGLTENNEWVYGLPLVIKDEAYIMDKDDTNKKTKVKLETLSQFINRLMDDEKTEIYENDIIYDREQYWHVKYSEALCGFQAVFHDNEKDFDFFLPITQVMEGKIVGNIFDNPDLVNKQIE